MSELFAPYRALGFVNDAVPFHLKKLGSEHFITVSIGKAWQVFNCDKLRVTLIAPQRDQRITAIASARDITYTACGTDIIVWRRQEEIARMKGHAAAPHILQLFGSFLLSASKEENVLYIWDTLSYSLYDSIDLRSEIGAGYISAILHPSTYLNKLLIATNTGILQLWNLKSKKRIYSFKTEAWASDNQQAQAAATPNITCMAQSTAVDVVAIGLASGRVVLLNLKFDQPVAAFQQEAGAVTAISFRTDGVAAFATGSSDGQIFIWRLDKDRTKQTLWHKIEHAHARGPVVSLAFLAGQPLMVSAAADNALKEWVFDATDGSARILRSREGHVAPPTKIRFYGDGHDVLSAGADRTLRIFNLLRPQQTHELSQGSLQSHAIKIGTAVSKLRLKHIVDFDASSARARDWSNVLTAHSGSHIAHAWSTESRALAKTHDTSHIFNNEHPPTRLQSVAVSACGNFGFVGTEDGRVERFNLQSGQFRGAYNDPQLNQAAESEEKSSGLKKKKVKESAAAASLTSTPTVSGKAHSQAVTGIAADGLNRLVVTSSLDGTVKFWSFHQRALQGSLTLPAPVARLVAHRDTDLCAAACDDCSVHVIDMQARRVVRTFSGHTNRITDMCFSPDGRWLVTACMDSSVRVFDLPSAALVDWFRFDKAVTSVAFSPNGAFLATTHVNNLGIFLWVNKSYFSTVALRTGLHEPIDMDLPDAGSDKQQAASTRHAARVAPNAQQQEQLQLLAALDGENDSDADEMTDVAASGDGEVKERADVATVAGRKRKAERSSTEAEAEVEKLERRKGQKVEQADGAIARRTTAAKQTAASGDEKAVQNNANDEAANLFSQIRVTPAADGGDPASTALVRLSGLPKAKWLNLSVIDIVKARNKPKEAPKAPEKAPFFLPLLAGPTPQLAMPSATAALGPQYASLSATEQPAAAAAADATPAEASMLVANAAALARDEENSRVVHSKGQTLASPFVSKLLEARTPPAGNHKDATAKLAALAEQQNVVTAFLKSLSPAAIDAEIRLLASDPTVEQGELALLLDYLTLALASRRDFEFLQAVLNVALKVHGQAIARYPSLVGKVRRLHEQVTAVWGPLAEQFQASLCLVGFFAKTQ